jgi:hypothetical protein
MSILISMLFIWFTSLLIQATGGKAKRWARAFAPSAASAWPL